MIEGCGQTVDTIAPAIRRRAKSSQLSHSSGEIYYDPIDFKIGGLIEDLV